MLGELGRTQLVYLDLHVDEHVGQVRTRGRQRIDALINSQIVEPLLQLPRFQCRRIFLRLAA